MTDKETQHSRPFHEQLRYERELRGLSQEDVAEKLGCNARTVGRWERGEAFPQPYYLQKIYALFDKNAEEMGVFSAGTSSTTSEPSSDADSPPSSASDDFHLLLREDWGEAPDVTQFYGRDKEQARLIEWITSQRCRVVCISGGGGFGKTALAIKVAQQIKGNFEFVFWRSLQNAPPLPQLLKQCLWFISDQHMPELGEKDENLVSTLLLQMRTHRCLLILDNVESILQPGQRAGQYREGYQAYGKLIKQIGEIQHQSCLILTSREKLQEVKQQESRQGMVRSLPLSGVGTSEGREILRQRDLPGTDEQVASLTRLYSGNPLALKLVATPIHELFGSQIALFLREEKAVFDDINDLLEQQFLRLPPLEQKILRWLAIEREATSLETLYDDLMQQVPKQHLMDALSSLLARSLIESKGPTLFTLQPVIMEYLVTNLVELFVHDLTHLGQLSAWSRYALIKAQTNDHTRDSQVRLLLSPVAQRLLSTSGKEMLLQKLADVLALQRQTPIQQGNYSAGNALNLLLHLGYDVRSFDFSSLMIRQAYLQNVTLQDVNFASASFLFSVFTNTFGNVLSASFSPQGHLLATGTATGDIWLYDVERGVPLLVCQGHTDGVWSVAFNTQGNLLASSSDDQTIRLWQVLTGECIMIIRGHHSRVRSLVFTHDETLLIGGSEDQLVYIWDRQTGECLKTLDGHTGRVWSIALNQDETLLATGGTDQTVRLWNLLTGECVNTLIGHTNWVRSVAFSPDSKTLASGGDDGVIRLWDVHSGQTVKIFQGQSSRIWSVAFSPDGKTVASGSEDQKVRLWNSESGHNEKTFVGHKQGIRTVIFHPDGQILASGGEDQTVRLWDVNRGNSLKTLQGYTKRIWSVAFHPDGKTLVSGSEDRAIHVWNIETGTRSLTLPDYAHKVRAIAFSPDGQFLASGGEDQTVQIRDARTGRILHVLAGHIHWVRALAFSPVGNMLASGSEDQTIRLWNARTGKYLKTLRGHTSWVRDLAFRFDGRMLASSGDDKTIRLWEIQSENCVLILQGHTGQIRSVAFSPNGHTLASGSEDQTIRLWNTENGECLNTLTGHTGWVRSVAFSADGQILASGSDDHSICLWDIASGQKLSMLRGHTDRVRSIAFTPDGEMLASCSDDGTIKIWEIQTAAHLKTLISERPYERMNITGVRGLTDAQEAALIALGAFVEL